MEAQDASYLKQRPELVPQFLSRARQLARIAPEGVEVEDLVQEAEMAAYKTCMSVEETPDRNFTALLAIRGKGAMLDFIRKQRWTPRGVAVVSHVSVEDDIHLEVEGSRAFEPSLEMEARQILARLERFVRRRPRHAALLALLVEGDSLATIGLALGFTESRACQMTAELRAAIVERDRPVRVAPGSTKTNEADDETVRRLETMLRSSATITHPNREGQAT